MQEIQIQEPHAAKIIQCLQLMDYLQKNGMDQFAANGAIAVAEYVHENLGLSLDTRVSFTRYGTDLVMSVFESQEEIDQYVRDRIAEGKKPLEAIVDDTGVKIRRSNV